MRRRAVPQKSQLEPNGRFRVAGALWRVRPVKGPLIDDEGKRCMCNVDWFSRRLNYDETLNQYPIVLAQLIAVAAGTIWDGEIKQATGGRPLDKCIDLAVQLN